MLFGDCDQIDKVPNNCLFSKLLTRTKDHQTNKIDLEEIVNLDESFGFVEREKFCNANADERGRVRVPELLVDLPDERQHLLKLFWEEVQVHRRGAGASQHARDSGQQRSELALQPKQLGQTLFNDRRKR